MDKPSSPKLMQWIEQNPDKSLIVCGLRSTSVECNLEIAQMLKDAELYELYDMMLLRIYQLSLDLKEFFKKENA